MIFKRYICLCLILSVFGTTPACEGDEESFVNYQDKDIRASAIGSYQAENHTFQSGCRPMAKKKGYTGSGYMDYGGQGSLVEWDNIKAPTAGQYTLVFRYANGSGSDRPCQVTVNDTNVVGVVAFADTGRWKNWESMSITAKLKAGNNKIRVTANTSSGGPNLDRMDVEAANEGGNTSGKCAEVPEFESTMISCPSGKVIVSIDFASYGLPEGSCDGGFSIGRCHSQSSKNEVEASCLGRKSCTVAAENDIFGDPCPGNGKKLAVTYSCITGNSDNDGNDDNDTNKKIKIFVLAGQSNMEGRGQVEPAGTNGTLANVVRGNGSDPLYSRLQDNRGDWVVRDDVWLEYPGDQQRVSANLTVGQGVNSETIGPEYGFGFEMGDFLKDDVIIIKAAWGGKSLAVDFRPPSSGGKTGFYYNKLLSVVDEAIARLLRSGRIAQGEYEIAGFGWHQGWNDAAEESYIEEYQKNLANLIRDLRKEWGKPRLPVVIGTSGLGGSNPPDSWFRDVSERIRPAQLAVAKDPEFKATVRAVDTISFWRKVSASPADEGYHWNRNAESYYLIGVGMGQAMKDLL